MKKLLSLALCFTCIALQAADSASQLMDNALKLKFGVDGPGGNEGNLLAVEEYGKVVDRFPNTKEAIVAKGNIAGIYIFNLNEPEKGRKILLELLERNDLSAEQAELFGNYLAVSTAKVSLPIEEVEQALKSTNPSLFPAVALNYCAARLADSVQEEPDVAEKSRETVNDILTDLLLNNAEVTLLQAMNARHLLGKVPVVGIVCEEMRLRKEGKPAKGSMVEEVTKGMASISVNEVKEGEFNLPHLYKTDSKVAIDYVCSLNASLLGAAIDCLRKDLYKGNFSEQSKQDLMLIVDLGGVKCTKALQRMLEDGKGEAGRNALQSAIKYLEAVEKEREEFLLK